MDDSNKQLHLQPTGISELDTMLNGGLPVGATILLKGTAGTGKTILASQWLFNGYKLYNEPGMFISLTESIAKYIRNVETFEFYDPSILNPSEVHMSDLREVMREKKLDGKPLSWEECRELIDLICHMVETIGAKRVVLDSITGLLLHIHTDEMIRFFIFELGKGLGNLDATVILTSEVSDSPDQNYRVEDFISDGIISLYQRVSCEDHPQRRLKVVKMRGVEFDEYPTSLQIQKEGIRLFPRERSVLKSLATYDRLAIDGQGLNEMLGGGIFKGSSIIISGPSGSGKTILSLQILYSALLNGEKGVYISFEESREQILRNASTFGWDFEKYEKEGKLAIISISLFSNTPEAHFAFIQNEVEKLGANILIFDAISSLYPILAQDLLKEAIANLITKLKSQAVTSILTIASPDLVQNNKISQDQLSTQSDSIIILRYIEIASEIRHGILVLKHRGSSHNKDVRELYFTEKGLLVGKSFSEYENLLSGSANTIKVMDPPAA
ncbi:MAG: Circadian clock protein kinase KaiC [Chlamydiia bacterium]|nr:Circadian clock protein kinase KaiC [Chlamydiia bacterium]